MTVDRPTVFGRYELLDLLAIGGMAEVFLARVRLGGIARTCVIKRILPTFSSSRQFVSMFIDEARITVGLEHENVVRLIDFGQVDGTYFMAIEFVDGVDLVAVLRAVRDRGGGVPGLAAVWIARSIARGLHAAHTARDHRGRSMGVVHRDVSPHNVFISWDGQVKIGDFGIAAARNKLSRTTPGTVMGKFGYMSPEQASGDVVDARTDVWAVGVVLWEMLVGGRLFATESPVDTVSRVLHLGVPPPSMVRPGIDPRLDAICLAALKRPIDERTQSAEAFALALDAFLDGKFAAPDLASTLVTLGLDRKQRGDPRRLRGDASSSSSSASFSSSSSSSGSSSTSSLPPMPMAGPGDRELRELMTQMSKEPSLELLLDVGDRHAALGQRGLALAAIRTASYLFAHRGLLVQAICGLHGLRPLVNAADFDGELRRLARLRAPGGDVLRQVMADVDDHRFWGIVRAVDPQSFDASPAGGLDRARAPLLGSLSEDDFVRLARLARVERKTQGSTVVREGERGDALYAVGRGRVVVHTRMASDDGASATTLSGQRAYLGALGEGDFFGEFSFLTQSPRSATVEAAADVVLLRFDRAVVDALVDADAAFRGHLLDFYKERVAELVLARNPVMGALPIDVRRSLIHNADVRKVRDGDVVVREGEDAAELFFLLAGEVEVGREASSFPVFINKLHEGQFFGEMAVLRDTPRTATVRAMGDVELLVIKRVDILSVLKDAEHVRAMFEQAMQSRSAESEARVRETERIFAGV